MPRGRRVGGEEKRGSTDRGVKEDGPATESELSTLNTQGLGKFCTFSR